MITPRDAATVMLVRDGSGGIEVFLLRRNLRSDFVGGAYVFPGGAVDEVDRRADLQEVCRGLSDDAASQRLGLPRGGLAFWVAAVRECFEEAGVLLAMPAGAGAARLVSFRDEAVAARFRLHRKAVDSGERRLVEVCRDEGLELAVDRIHYFSHWITPEGPPRRYDTRFFVAAAPPEQVPLHDERETVASLWLRPAEALRRYRAGELDLILPTIKNLEAIERFDSSTSLLAAAASKVEVPTVEPLIVPGPDGNVRILLPGDAGYEEAKAGA
ncbi:MAG: NUDIX domain-containing protein [Actinobacteria bacterium]|nr:NUDIX domain-containing protein [Actinomycetota bacterium]